MSIGKTVYPILLDGTTYLPIRAISNLFENPVKWDGENNRVLLGKGEMDTVTVKTITEFVSGENETVSPLLNQDITIIYKERPQTFTNVNGVQVFPLSYEGTTYLPVRAISNMYGANIEWNGETSRITITRENKLANIMNVTVKVVEGTVCAVVSTDNPVYDYKYYSLEDPNRVILDLQNTNFAMNQNTQEINYETVKSIRFGDQGNNLSRVVLDLDQIGTYSVAQSKDRLMTYLALTEDFEIPDDSKINDDILVASIGNRIIIPKIEEKPTQSGEGEQLEIPQESGEVEPTEKVESGIEIESGESVEPSGETEMTSNENEKVYGETENESNISGELSTQESGELSEEEIKNLAKVTSVKYSASTGRTRVTITGDYKYEKMMLEEPNRLVVDIIGAILEVDGPSEINPKNKNITAIRFAQYEKDKVRFVFDLKEISEYEIVKGARTSYLDITIVEPSYRNIKYETEKDMGILILEDVKQKVFNTSETEKSNKFVITYTSSKFDSGKGTMEINDDFVKSIEIKTSKITLTTTGKMNYEMEQDGDNVILKITKKVESEETSNSNPKETKENTGVHANTVTRSGKYSVNQITDTRVQVGKIYINNSSGLTINLKELSKKSNLAINSDTKILVYHSHTSEGYVESGIDSNFHTTDNDLNVVAVGEALKNALKAKDIYLYHDKTRYDVSYNDSYDSSLEGIEKLFKKDWYDISIDLHRDAVSSDLYYGPTVEVNGKKAAKLMFVMGSTAYGLEHPYWMENLKTAVLIQNKAEEMYPGLFRDISLTKYRYNEHLTPGGTLMEVGATGNSMEEVEYSMKLLANVLAALDE